MVSVSAVEDDNDYKTDTMIGLQCVHQCQDRSLLSCATSGSGSGGWLGSLPSQLDRTRGRPWLLVVSSDTPC